MAQNAPFGGLRGTRTADRPLRLDLVPTAADWSDCVGTMVNTHFGLVTALTGSFLDFFGAKTVHTCIIHDSKSY